MKKTANLSVRQLQNKDIPVLNAHFSDPDEKWSRYFKEQKEKTRTVYLIEKEGSIAGYATFLRNSEYAYFRKDKTPEISDLWIAKEYRGKGLGTLLIKTLEEVAKKEGYEEIGIGVGLSPDYGSAQKLYFRLGYAPDGRGIAYKYQTVMAGESYPVDDNLILWLWKTLNSN